MSEKNVADRLIENSLRGLITLGAVFVALKLVGFLSWSWNWVLAPFWIPLVLLLLAGIGYLLYAWE